MSRGRATHNAIITYAWLGAEDNGIITAKIGFDYGGLSQQFGGYALHLPPSFKHSTCQKDFCGHFISRMLYIADCKGWNDLVGRPLRVDCDDSRVYAIGHFLRNQWFNPEEEFSAIRAVILGDSNG